MVVEKNCDTSWILNLNMNAENFAFLQESLIRLAKAENILNEYQSMSCSICSRHFGYKDRRDPSKIICSAPCMALQDFKNYQKNNQQHFLTNTVPSPTISLETQRCQNPLSSVDVNRSGVDTVCTVSTERKVLKPSSVINRAQNPFLRDSLEKRASKPESCIRASIPKGYDECQHSGCVGKCSFYDGGSSSRGYHNNSSIYKSLPGGTSIFLGSSSYEGETGSERESVDETDKSRRSFLAKKVLEDNSATREDSERVVAPSVSTVDSFLNEVAVGNITEDQAETNTILANSTIKSDKIPHVLTQDKATLPTKQIGKERVITAAEIGVPLERCSSGNSTGSGSSNLRGNESIIELARKKPNETSRGRAEKLHSMLKGEQKLVRMSTTKKSASVSLSGEAMKKVLPLGKKTRSNILWTKRNIMPSLSFKAGSACYVQYVWSPIKFTLTAASDSSKLSELQSGISTYCKQASAMTRCPDIGDIVFSSYMEDFYRAEVRDVNKENGVVQVTFLDYGDTAKVKISDCQEPSDLLMKEHPIYGIVFECNMNASTFSRIKLPSELRTVLEGKFFIGKDFECRNEFEWIGTLYLDSACQESWNRTLEKHVHSERENELVEAGNKKTCTSTVISDAALMESSSSNENIFANMMSPKKPKRKPFQRFLQNSMISPSLKNGAIVRVNHLWKYNKLSVSAVEDDEKIQQLADLILEHEKKAPPMKRTPCIDEMVIAPYQGEHYRGVVESVVDGVVEVRFLDFGDAVSVNVSELKEINEEIDAHPIYGIIFKLLGVPENLPKFHVDGLEEALESRGQMEVTKLEHDMWTGYLWVASDRNWNDLILDAWDKVKATIPL